MEPFPQVALGPRHVLDAPAAATLQNYLISCLNQSIEERQRAASLYNNCPTIPGSRLQYVDHEWALVIRGRYGNRPHATAITPHRVYQIKEKEVAGGAQILSPLKMTDPRNLGSPLSLAYGDFEGRKIARVVIETPFYGNMFSLGMAQELSVLMKFLAGREDVQAVTIAGRQATCDKRGIPFNSFSQGADLYHIAQAEKAHPGGCGLYVSELTRSLNAVVQTIHMMPQPVIAIIQGPVAGISLGLALACDMRIGTKEALFASSSVQVGLAPSGGVSVFLPRLVGEEWAALLMMSGLSIFNRPYKNVPEILRREGLYAEFSAHRRAPSAQRLGLMSFTGRNEEFDPWLRRMFLESPSPAVALAKKALRAHLPVEELARRLDVEREGIVASCSNRETLRRIQESAAALPVH